MSPTVTGSQVQQPKEDLRGEEGISLGGMTIVRNDADLNQTYQELLAQSMKSGGSGLQDRFRQSQREWINTRDSDCQGAGDGALWARARARCLADYSAKRTAELQRSLNSLRGQE